VPHNVQTNAHATNDNGSNNAMSPLLIVVLLALLMGIQPITTDLYLPALPLIRNELDASMMQMQLTLTALSLSFGLSQLVWGPVSDRFGRRPVLIAGLSAYTVAAIAGVLAPSIEALIVWRVVQGAAMGASVMGARAIVRDLYEPIEGARMMSKGLSGLGLIACLSAPIGGLLTQFFGWRAVLTAVTLFGAATLLLAAKRFKETNQHLNPMALRPATVWHNWRTVASSSTFWAYTAIAAASYAGLFTFLASSSFVFIGVFGVSKVGYGGLMLIMTTSYLSGTFLCRRLIKHVGVVRTVRIGGFMSIASGTSMGALSLLTEPTVWTTILPFLPFMVAHGIHNPCGQSGAVSQFPKMAGAASALNGFMTMALAFGVGTWMGMHAIDSVYPLTLGVWFWSVCLALAAWVLVGRYGQVATTPAAAPPTVR
jgi:MFS transporter, DHA1 family, multidrug resistance protein